MLSNGYEVTGSKSLLAEMKNQVINWNLFSSGEKYFDDNGNPYIVEINHDEKTVVLEEF
ncbi:MAG: hypothetical protein NC345_13980 [Lachnospira sp.]|nr:hypothetical protein [Lachnospira sp.]